MKHFFRASHELLKEYEQAANFQSEQRDLLVEHLEGRHKELQDSLSGIEPELLAARSMKTRFLELENEHLKLKAHLDEVSRSRHQPVLVERNLSMDSNKTIVNGQTTRPSTQRTPVQIPLRPTSRYDNTIASTSEPRQNQNSCFKTPLPWRRSTPRAPLDVPESIEAQTSISRIVSSGLTSSTSGRLPVELNQYKYTGTRKTIPWQGSSSPFVQTPRGSYSTMQSRSGIARPPAYGVKLNQKGSSRPNTSSYFHRPRDGASLSSAYRESPRVVRGRAPLQAVSEASNGATIGEKGTDSSTYRPSFYKGNEPR